MTGCLILVDCSVPVISFVAAFVPELVHAVSVDAGVSKIMPFVAAVVQGAS